MKRIFFKAFFGIMCLCLVIYILSANSPRYAEKTIDLTGGNDFWHATLNIDLQYDSELIISPGGDFEIPSEISIDIIVKNKCVYTDKLKYIPAKLGWGIYTVRLKSDDYFKKDFDDIKLIIRFNNQSSSIILRKSPNIL